MIEIQLWWLIILPVFFGLGWLAARIDIKHVLAETRSLPAQYFQGLNHLLNGDTNRAVEVYVDIAKLHAETSELQFTLGHLFRRRGELERAIRMHQRLLDRKDLSDNHRQQATLELAIDFMKAGLYDRAEDLLHQLADTNFARQARRELLAIYQQEHEWKKAIELAQQLRDESHGYQHEIAHFHCELAAQAMLHARHEEVSRELEAALQANRQCARARVMLGEHALAQQQHEQAITEWGLIEKQDVLYLALVARHLLAAFDAVGKTAEGERYLQGLLQQHPDLDVLDVLYERILARSGAEAVSAFVRERLREHPTMPGLRKVLEAYLLQAPSEQQPDLEIIVRLIHEENRENTVYYCGECGFRTRQYFWHCPACNAWESYPPVRGQRRLGH
ncbi:lipopolysaccharide assembly protein LapB [Chitinilyticum piscinae]|uniref:Lipopolysaccharide assembly protein B n=1 Tax=Chitinilyticum piscinae TaxID=2866724 RepID=A0A8J7FHC1_9NEIS|nr:lipopolysaccharide assembly protein LapB [Chitinilyticum piscinae]MBE9609453.1 lipopolysaccharide assembly protein LapB [Chitinilyticum piscinae]